MANVNKSVNLVVGLAVAGLLVAFLLPVAIGAFGGVDETTLDQSVDDTDTLTQDLNVTLDAVTESTSATYTVSNDNDSATNTVNVGTAETFSVDGYDVSINVTSTGTGSSTADVEYPGTYGWGGAASTLWTVIPVLIVISVFLLFIRMAVNQS